MPKWYLLGMTNVDAADNGAQPAGQEQATLVPLGAAEDIAVEDGAAQDGAVEDGAAKDSAAKD
ncbi:hypothetical protein BC828DRAFT_410063, partial [Blastocladiella britannica]